MSMDRREFLKIAGVSTILGIGGLTTAVGLRNEVEASQIMSSPEALKGKRWGMVVDVKKLDKETIKKCIDACHRVHNVPYIDDSKHEIKWIWEDTFEHAFPDQLDVYKADEIKNMPFLLLCNHCDNPPCVRVCPTQATFKREDGIVMQDMHRCIGCRFCMAACPYGSRSFNFINPKPFIKNKEENLEYPARMKGVVEKCLFCQERLAVGKQPACVEASNGALIFGDLEDPNSEVRKVLSSNITIQRKPELGTRPSVYYLI